MTERPEVPGYTCERGRGLAIGGLVVAGLNVFVVPLVALLLTIDVL